MANACPVPMRAISAPASAVGNGAPVALRPVFEPADPATSLASPLNCTSPEVLNESTSPLRTVIPVDVHAWRGETEIPEPVAAASDALDPLVAVAGRASTMRAICDDDTSRSPELVLKVILSGEVPPIS